MAGWLVGRVGERHLDVRPDGSTRAVLQLKLDKAMEPLPADTTVRMRSQSTLGGNYVELLPGHSREPLRGDPHDPRGRAAQPVSLSDSLAAYDKRTRAAMGRYLGGAGDTLVGRGPAITRSSPWRPTRWRTWRAPCGCCRHRKATSAASSAAWRG